MPNRSSAVRTPGRGYALGIDVVLFAPRDGTLAVLLVRSATSGSREQWSLPTDTLRAGESLDDAAMRIAREALGVAPTHLEQITALGGARRPTDGLAVTIAYAALTPVGTSAGRHASWIPVPESTSLAARQREEIERCIAAIRARIDHHPIAFGLLPDVFTLSELQAVYEMLLGRSLHKASFRRSLHAAAIVEPTDEWRSEGRGRPAQLFRYAPPRRRRPRRGVRFDLLG
jgi:ADP-ribose pyrophosphatase YjhB (NUDIX family)